jgi:hypothetical protein
VHSLSLSTLSLCAWYINFSFYFLFQTISLSSTRFYLSLFLSDISRYVFGDLLVLPLNICSLKNFGDYYYLTTGFSSFFAAFWDNDLDFFRVIWCILGLNVHSLSSSFYFILFFYYYCIYSLSFFFYSHSIYRCKNYSFLGGGSLAVSANDEFATGYSVIRSVISNCPLSVELVPTMICCPV